MHIFLYKFHYYYYDINFLFCMLIDFCMLIETILTKVCYTCEIQDVQTGTL